MAIEKLLHKRQEKIKDVTAKFWIKRLERCNPFDNNDLDIQQAKTQKMPNSGFVYSKFRGREIEEMDAMTMLNWASGNSGRSKFPKLEIACLMAYVNMYGIHEWIEEEGMSKEEVQEQLVGMGFKYFES